MTKNGGASKTRGGLYGWSVEARAIYPPSQQRALVAPARAESYAQLRLVQEGSTQECYFISINGTPSTNP